mmetsp:Transcript_15252/g.18569  ORF Transcript_15252/g.18569 Transcript_15252/m.18569 type:complete len:1068 (+) Transcript_15252:124-3327(+)
MSEDLVNCGKGEICSVDGTDRRKPCNDIRNAAIKGNIGDIHAGMYCPEGRTGYENCPAGYYCPTPSTKFLCPQGYFCPYKSSDYTIECFLCEEGAEDMGRNLVGLVCCLTIFVGLVLYSVFKLLHKLKHESEENRKSQKNKVLSSDQQKEVRAKEQKRLGRMTPILRLVEERIKSKWTEASDVKIHELDNIFEEDDDTKLKFNSDLLYRFLDADFSGDLSFTEINEVLELNKSQIQNFITTMNEAGGNFKKKKSVDKNTFIDHFLNTLEYSTNFGVSSDEAGTLYDELLAESGRYAGLSQSHFHESRKLGDFLDSNHIVMLLEGFRTKREEAGVLQNAKKYPIKRAEFVEWYPSVLEDIMNEHVERRDSFKEIPGIDLTFENLSLSIPLGGGDSFNVVDEVSGRLKEKTMTALMGGSGAGKTSMLNALCGRAYYGEVTGKIFLNGIEVDMDQHKSIMGFVPQDDIVYAELTVRENFMFSGRFQLPSSTPRTEIETLAENTMANLGLSRVADSLVGDVRTRGVSGGEKKRVNIGLELMAKPRILFLDEPTSGLDSSSADLVMKSLKALVTNQGVTICTVIHQPRKSIFDMIDSLVLLGVGGKMVYHGPCANAQKYFEREGWVLPMGDSAADWLIDISSGRLERGTIKNDTKANLGIQRKFEIEKLNRASLCNYWIEYFESLDPAEKVQYQPPDATEIVDRTGKPSFLRQFIIQLERCFLVAYRNRLTKVVDSGLIMFAAFIVSFGSTLSVATDNDPVVSFDTFYSINPTRTIKILPEFFKYSLNAFRALSEYGMKMGVILSVLIGLTATKILTSKRVEFFREAKSGYNINAYFLAVNVISTIEQGLQIMMAALVGLWLKNTTTSVWNYLVNYLMLSWHCVSWALFLPLLVPNQNVVLVVGLFMSLFGLLFSGVLSPVQYEELYNNRGTEIFSAFVSPARFFIEAMMVSEFKCLPQQSGFTSNASNAQDFPAELSSFALLNLGSNDNEITDVSCGGWWWFVLPSFLVGLTIRFVAFGTLHISDRGQQAKLSVMSEFTGKNKNISFMISCAAMMAIIAVLFIATCWVIVN